MIILDVAPNLAGSGRAANPIAGQACYLGLAWGPGAGMGQVFQVALSVPGATIDPTFKSDTIQSNVSTAPYSGLNLGWAPDNKPIWLTSQQAAYGIWKVTFPSAQQYTLTLGNAGQATITAVAAPAAPVLVTLVLLRTSAMGNISSRVFGVSFSGNYPAGGFPLHGADLGLATPFWGHINDTASYRFAYDPVALALHVYNSSGEVGAGSALSFSTTGLFHGSAQ